MPITIETIALADLALVPGTHDDPPGRASVTEVSRIHAQALLDDLAYRIANMPGESDPWPAWRAREARRSFGPAIPPFYPYWVSCLENVRWLAEFGPLALSCWVLRIEAAEALPRLSVQRIDGQLGYHGHHTCRPLLSAARREGLATLVCEVYED